MKLIGKLIRTYEAQASIYGDTKRMHEVQVLDIYIYYGSGYEVGETVELDGDTVNMYEYIA